jgi:hypothetical protein
MFFSLCELMAEGRRGGGSVVKYNDKYLESC